jgi:hypothetical protein
VQVSTLNKIVSIFLVGGLTLLASVCILWNHFGPFTLSNNLVTLLTACGDGLLAIAGGLLFISLAALAGTVTEALTDATTRKLIERASGRKWLAALFMQSEMFEARRFWKERFEIVASQEDLFSGFPLDTHGPALAAGVFYETAQEENLHWLESHYATFLVLTNLGFLTALGGVYVLALSFAGGVSILGVLLSTLSLLLLFWVFGSFALDRYLFTYIFALRQATVATILMRDLESGRSTGGSAHNPGAAPDVNRAMRGRRR